MAQKRETLFRSNTVIPFLDTLKNTAYFPIQQKAIRGDPDFMLCVHGVFVALELKAEDGDADPLQRYKLEQIKRAKGVALIARPSNWPEIKLVLEKLDRWGGGRASK
jgi:hypothetical protein